MGATHARLRVDKFRTPGACRIEQAFLRSVIPVRGRLTQTPDSSDSPSVTSPAAARPDESSYTASRRALTRCVRELESLTTTVVKGAKELAQNGVGEQAVIRQSPNRCIVQFGGVALTIAWLQSPAGSVADGELLVILWEGQVAPASSARSEAAFAAVPRSAVAQWEGIFVVEAESEDTWRWRSNASGDRAFSSTELANHCIERLRDAFRERAARSSSEAE